MTMNPSADPATVATETLANNVLVDELIKSSAGYNCVEAVETVISSLAEEGTAMVNHSETGGHLWKFKYGSVEVFVQLSGLSDEDTFTAWSSVLKLPVQKEAQLLRKLLGMNWSETFEARFSVIDNEVVVNSTRTVADLSPGEISRVITVVASIADDNDEALQTEFPPAD